MSHWVGLGFQAPSMPLVVVCTPLPVPKLFFQPRPISSSGAASGSGPTSFGSPAPCALPKVCPPATSATVSSSFMRHAGEGLTHIAARSHGVGVAVGTFGVHIDQAHLHGSQRILQIAVAAVALVAQPGVFVAPVDIFLGLPDVDAAAAETEGLEAHRLQRHVAGQDHQVGPGDFVAIFLFDGPEQAARLVQVDVVGPAVERRKTLVAGAAAAASVSGAVGAGAVPGHADEQAAVVAPVGGPPLLRVGHQRGQVFLHRGQIKLLEFFGVVEIRAHRVGGWRVLVQDVQVQLVGPPVAVRCASAGSGSAGFARYRAFAFFAHFCSPFSFGFVQQVISFFRQFLLFCHRQDTDVNISGKDFLSEPAD